MRDYDIRLALKANQLNSFYYDGSVIVEELDLTIAGARVDIAVVNGSLHAFEIKSEKDTLQRLPNQLQAYLKVFDFISVVTSKKHLQKVENILLDCIGLYICNEDLGTIEVYKTATPNPATESFHIAKLLRKDELFTIATDYEIKFKKTDRHWTLCEMLSVYLSKEDLSLQVRKKLKQRENWKVNSKAGLRFL